MSERSAREERGLTLADPDAERRQPVAAAAPAQLVEQRDDEARAAHPERVADGDRTAVHVHAVAVEAEFSDDGKALRCERLVQLDEIELADRNARASEKLANRRHRPDPHQTR